MARKEKRKRKSGVVHRKDLVAKLMTRKIVSLTLDYDLEKVSDIFLKNNISGAPVFSKGFLVGEISRSDILNFLEKRSLDELNKNDRNILRKHTAIELMKRPICIFENEDIKEAMKKMRKYKIRRLFVIDKKKRFAGIITENDLMSKKSTKTGKERVRTESMLRTQLDDMLNILEQGPADLKKLSKMLKTPETLIEHWGKTLEEHGMVELSYPVVGSPVMRLKKPKEKLI